MEKYDLIIVGAGPAGIFTAVEMLRHGSKKKMLLVEKGTMDLVEGYRKAKTGKKLVLVGTT